MKISHKSQDGVALPVAAGMLMVISILAVGFFTVATRVNTTSVSDRSSKRALAAAEAGLQMAVYRLNLLNQSATANAANCLTTTWVAPTGGECPGQPGSLGNGAGYTYYVTPATPAGSAGCVTLPGVATSAIDRCITSVGLVNGVRRRLQARVVSEPTIPPFNQVGLIGKSLVYAYNSAKLISDVGSNESVVFHNSVNVEDNTAIDVDGKVMILAGGTYTYANSVKIDGGTQTITTPFELPTPDPAFDTVEAPSGNNNAALPDSVFEGGSAGRHLRRFQLGVNGSPGEYTMPPGTYHFCNVRLGNSVKWKFSHTGGQRTKIYVDSPARADSESCAGQADPAGTFTADNSVEINKEVGEREELLDIYMYGTDYNDTRPNYSWCEPIHHPNDASSCKSDFMLDNSVNLYGAVYAPNSSIQAHNSAKIWGALAADKLLFFNSVDFTLTGEMKNRPGEGNGAAQRRGWAECAPLPSVATDPESGC
jgi:type II secretory pathway pseudopilin PulG